MNSSPKSNMLTRFKKKFLPKNRKYDVANGCQDGPNDVTLSRYEQRSKSGSFGSNSGSPKHQNSGIIWHNNTYDLLPFQLETISPKPSIRQNSLPSRRQGGEELPPLPLKAREAGDPKKQHCDNGILLDGCKTPSPTDSTYVTPRPLVDPKERTALTKTEPEKTPDTKEDGEELLPPPCFRDCDETVEEDREYPATWLRSPRVKSPNASVSTPSPTDSESKGDDGSLTSDSTATEKKPDIKKREKAPGGVKPPMLRPLRKKKPPPGPGEKRDSKNIEKEDAPLPPPPPKDEDKLKNSPVISKIEKSPRDSGLSSEGSVIDSMSDPNKKIQAGKDGDEPGYTSMDELQEHLRINTLPAPPPVLDIPIDDDAPFPPPPPPLAEVFAVSTPKNIEVEEGEPLKQTIVRPRYKDGLLGYDGSTDTVDGPAEKSKDRLSSDFGNVEVQRNISHESGYETSGIEHSSSSEHIRDDVFPDPVQDLIAENLDYGEELELRKGPIYRETTEVSLLSQKAVRDMYAFVPKTGVPRSASNQSDTSTDNYPESPENTGTSNSVSSPEDDGDRDTLKMSTEVLLPISVPAECEEGEALILDDEDVEEDYLPPIPTRNYQHEASRHSSNCRDTSVDVITTVDEDVGMMSSMCSDVSVESTLELEPVHMSLDEVREQAKTLGVPLSVTNHSVNQSQPCITAKTRSLSETSNEPVSPTSKHNTFPIDKSSTPTSTPKKHGTGTKKKPKLRIPNIFSRSKSSNNSSPEHGPRCELHDTIQRRSLPAPPPRAPSDGDDSDKTPVGSPAHQRSSSGSTCQIHGTMRSNGSSAGSSGGGYARNMPGREWSTAPRQRTQTGRCNAHPRPLYKCTETAVNCSGSPSHSTLSLASSNHSGAPSASATSSAAALHSSLGSSVTSVNSALSSSGYATNSTTLSSTMHTNSNADFISSLSKLKHVGWYWGPLSWDEAESKINNKPDGSFLVRDSSDDRYILSLSFRSQNLTHHTRIEHYKGMFSFYSQPKSHGAATIIEFIEKAMEHSRNGKFLYFLRPRAPGLPPAPVQLLFPISRFRTLQSLQHICRFEIIKHVRKDHIHLLPIPQKIKDYLLHSQYYIEEYS